MLVGRVTRLAFLEQTAEYGVVTQLLQHVLTSVRAAAATAAGCPAGEFEKHAGCWMGWPYDKYLWREDALPAKKQYAAGELG
jgi:hypothetical protein